MCLCPTVHLSAQAETLTRCAVTNVEEAHGAAQELLRRGCKAVIITLGPQGCVVLQAPESTSKHVPTTAVATVDTTVSTLEEVNDAIVMEKEALYLSFYFLAIVIFAEELRVCLQLTWKGCRSLGKWSPLTRFYLPDSNLLKRPVPLDWEAKPLISYQPLWPVFVTGALTSCLRSV